MPTVSSSQLPPPKSWDEFEEICADLFQLEWNDPNAVRHGRQGQRQNGVDIYGCPEAGKYKGVQCKGKSIWPPTKLKNKEIDGEVKKALSFKPALSTLTFVTTAPDDANAQKHARLITERQLAHGLFSVHVLGWGEITRRLSNHPSLMEKHFGFTGLREIRDQIKAIPQNSADLIVPATPLLTAGADKEIIKLTNSMRKNRFLFGSDSRSDAIQLSNLIIEGDLRLAASENRSRSLAWCARLLAESDTDKAKMILDHAVTLATCEECGIAGAFIKSAKEEYSEALAQLYSLDSPSSRSAAFAIVIKSEGAEQANKWLEKVGVSFADIGPDEKFIFLAKNIESSNWSTLVAETKKLTSTDFLHTPALLFAAAISELAEVIPLEHVKDVVNQIPFDPRKFPLSSSSSAIEKRRNATRLLGEFSNTANEIGATRAANIGSDYVLWLELRDPDKAKHALVKLRESMNDPEHSLRRLNLALHYGIEVNFEVVNAQIDRAEALTGNTSSDASFARFVLAFVQDTPAKVADYIENFRDQISRQIDTTALGFIEVQMLTAAGRIEDAKQCLERLELSNLDSGNRQILRQLIDEATGSDPFNARIKQYESDPTIGNLANLVDLLESNNDWDRLSHFGALLFERTNDLRDAERLATAMNNSENQPALASLLRSHENLRSQSTILQAFWCQILLREGAVLECSESLNELVNTREDHFVRQIAFKLAITSGDWEALGPLVEQEWVNRDTRTAGELLYAAQIAQSMNLMRTRSLIGAAIEKADQDPGIYVGAYTIATKGGWDNKAETGEWLSKAIELSHEEGPVRQASLKDFSRLQGDWTERYREITRKLQDGEMPVFVAALSLNRSLVDFFLMPALANQNESDPRHRSNVYAYGGARQTTTIRARSVSLDPTTLLTLAFLEIVPETIRSFDQILIPHSTLGWLLEEFDKARFHQPSRIAAAKELRQLIDDGQLHLFTLSERVNQNLVKEVGVDLASLIAEAENGSTEQSPQRIVVRSYPVHKVGSLLDEVANLDDHQAFICSCTAIVEKLKQKGQLSTVEEKQARAYLNANELQWPSEPAIEDGAIVYLDDLTISYLQHLGLLQKLSAAGLTAYVSSAEIDEMKALIRFESVSTMICQSIESLRTELAEGIRSGKIRLGQIPAVTAGQNDRFRLHPAANIYDLGLLVDLIVVDDRCLSNQVSSPVATSWELINLLHEKGALDLETMLDRRTMLRKAGYVLAPVEGNELEHYLAAAQVIDGKLAETAELRAIRENVLQVRMTGSLKLPLEANWLNNLIRIAGQVLKSQWTEEINNELARARSTWLLQFLDLRLWPIGEYLEERSALVTQSHMTQTLSLLLLPDSTNVQSRNRYWKWVEETILEPLRQENPDAYKELIESVKKLIFRTTSDVSEEKQN